jgi:hypothetical protein
MHMMRNEFRNRGATTAVLIALLAIFLVSVWINVG